MKRKFIFKYKPEFLESFTTTIKEDQVIPLILHVFEKLKWSIVYHDDKIVEAKYNSDFNGFTEKIIIAKGNSGTISVHSVSIKSRFTDLGTNSIRTGTFIKHFKKLEKNYETTEKLEELALAYKRESNWEDYEIPTELPKPKEMRAPSPPLAIIGGILIALTIGFCVGFMTIQFTYYVLVYEAAIGIATGYLLARVLKFANYTKYQPTLYILAGGILTTFLVNQYTQYQLIISEKAITDLGFIEYIKLRFEQGLTINELETGWIGLIISWIFQLIAPYYIAQSGLAISLMQYDIDKIPQQVIEYTIYLFEMNKPESEVRAELSRKGWNKTSDQNAIFEAIGAINGFQQFRRN